MAKNYISEFQFVSDAYNSDGGFYNGSCLDKFKRESDGTVSVADNAYQDRKDASKREYEDIFSSKVSRYIGYLFKSPPQRESDNELIAGIKKDANLRSDTINVFMSDFAKNMKARGVNLLLVDTPNTLADNMQEQIKHRLSPYFVEILPERVTEYKLDNFGQFEYVSFSDTIDNSEYGNTEVDEIVRYYDKTEWRIYDMDGAILDRKDHGFKVCPVLIGSEKGSFESLGEFAQLAGLSKRLFNLNSEKKLMLRGQTFSILTVWTEKGSEPTINLGIDNALLYSGDHPPSYISSDVAQAQEYSSEIEEVKESMDRVAYDVSTTSAQESGIALEIKFESLNSSLNSFAQKMESLERSAWALATEALGLQEETIMVTYNLDFAITDLTSDIATLDSIDNITDLPKYRAAKLKKIVTEDLKGTEDEVLDDILTEIDDAAKVSEVE